jgi:hypothetical protein
MAFLVALQCLAVASADNTYPVAVGGGTFSQEILDDIWKIPVIAGIVTQILSILNTIYTFIVNMVLTPPILGLGKGENWDT